MQQLSLLYQDSTIINAGPNCMWQQIIKLVKRIEIVARRKLSKQNVKIEGVCGIRP